MMLWTAPTLRHQGAIGWLGDGQSAWGEGCRNDIYLRTQELSSQLRQPTRIAIRRLPVHVRLGQPVLGDGVVAKPIAKTSVELPRPRTLKDTFKPEFIEPVQALRIQISEVMGVE